MVSFTTPTATRGLCVVAVEPQVRAAGELRLRTAVRQSAGREEGPRRGRCRHRGRLVVRSKIRHASRGEVMQVELADAQGVEHLHSLRQSGAALDDQPGITNSFGCHTEVAGEQRAGELPGGEVDHSRLAGYRPRARNWPQNLPRPMAIEEHADLERPPVQVVLSINAGQKHLAERVVDRRRFGAPGAVPDDRDCPSSMDWASARVAALCPRAALRYEAPLARWDERTHPRRRDGRVKLRASLRSSMLRSARSSTACAPKPRRAASARMPIASPAARHAFTSARAQLLARSTVLDEWRRRWSGGG